MNLELTGALGYIATFCFVLTGAMIIILGTFYILNYFVWEIIVTNILLYLKAYPSFYRWIFNRHKFDKWYKDEIEKMDNIDNETK